MGSSYSPFLSSINPFKTTFKDAEGVLLDPIKRLLYVSQGPIAQICNALIRTCILLGGYYVLASPRGFA